MADFSHMETSPGDRETLQREVAGLPSGIARDDMESRLFDLRTIRMQLAWPKETPGDLKRTGRAWSRSTCFWRGKPPLRQLHRSSDTPLQCPNTPSGTGSAVPDRRKQELVPLRGRKNEWTSTLSVWMKSCCGVRSRRHDQHNTWSPGSDGQRTVRTTQSRSAVQRCATPASQAA